MILSKKHNQALLSEGFQYQLGRTVKKGDLVCIGVDANGILDFRYIEQLEWNNSNWSCRGLDLDNKICRFIILSHENYMVLRDEDRAETTEKTNLAAILSAPRSTAPMRAVGLEEEPIKVQLYPKPKGFDDLPHTGERASDPILQPTYVTKVGFDKRGQFFVEKDQYPAEVPPMILKETPAELPPITIAQERYHDGHHIIGETMNGG